MKHYSEVHSYPWYFHDWFLSETRASMNAEERGIYRELLDLCWFHGSLPDDPRTIQQWICAETHAPFADILKKILGQFKLGKDGRWHHPKVDEKRKIILDLKTQRRESAIRGGYATQQKYKNLAEGHKASHEASHEAGRLVSSSPSPSPSPSPYRVESKAAAFSTRGREAKSRPPVAAAAAAAEDEDEHGAERKPPGSVTGNGASTHDAEKVELVRAYLGEVAKIAHLPPADDALVRRVLVLTGAAHPREIFEAIRDLNYRRRFDNVKSWGLIPVLLEPYFFKSRERQAAAP